MHEGNGQHNRSTVGLQPHRTRAWWWPSCTLQLVSFRRTCVLYLCHHLCHLSHNLLPPFLAIFHVVAFCCQVWSNVCFTCCPTSIQFKSCQYVNTYSGVYHYLVNGLHHCGFIKSFESGLSMRRYGPAFTRHVAGWRLVLCKSILGGFCVSRRQTYLRALIYAPF